MVKKILKRIMMGALGLSLCFELQSNIIQQPTVNATTKAQTKTFKLMINNQIKEYVKISSSNGKWVIPQNIIKKYSSYNLTIDTNKLMITAKWKSTSFDFRNVNFGWSLSQVKQAESKILNLTLEQKNSLYYKNVKILGFDAELVYLFNSKNQLMGAMYNFKIDHINNNDYIDDYKSIKNSLIGKYGQGTNTTDDNDMKWKDDTYKDYPDLIGQAVVFSHLQYLSSWSFAGKNMDSIILRLYGDNGDAKINLCYYGNNDKYGEEQTEDTSGI